MSVDSRPEPLRSPFALSERALRIAARFGLRSGSSLNSARLIGAWIALGWLPPLLLCLVAGTAYGDRVSMPFLHDFLADGRYLVAAPLLLLMDAIVERRTSLALAHLRESGLIAEVDEAVQRIVLTATRAWRSPILHWGLIVLTYAFAAQVFWFARASGVSNWMFDGEAGAERLSLAGTFNVLVSGAIVKYLMLRALCKLTLWHWVLWRLSKLRLRISPLHPDRCCGLRFLGWTQLAFFPLISALSVQLGCVIATSVEYHGAPLAGFKWVAAVFVVLSVVLLLGSLLVFARQTRLVIEEGGLRFAAWASLAARYTAEERVSAHDDPADQLSQPEISAFTDASALFVDLSTTRPVPIDKLVLMEALTAAIVPMLLPLSVLLPLDAIMKELVKIVL